MTERASAPMTTGFADLGLRPELLAAVADLGYEEPSPIQRDAIPKLLDGRDVLGQAATGTGKTAAFALPALSIVADLDRGNQRGRAPVVLVLVPTRELAIQVSEAMYRYGRSVGARVVPIYGGAPIGRQLGALRDGVDVVVATPGRAIDHLQRHTLSLDDLRVVVLDEADEMLDMGFAEDLETILERAPAERQTVLFSATLPARITAIARRHQRDPVRIEIGRAPVTTAGSPLVSERAYIVGRPHKPAALGRVLDVEAPAAALVFCRTRTEVDQLTEVLNGRGYRAEALHGGLNQEGRERVMGRLRTGTAELLIATDVAARGLDVDLLTHVINYDVPSDPDAYTHRIGRVGRAGREGVAITLAEPREVRLLRNIERSTGRTIAIDPLPSVADLRSRRLELTTAKLREALATPPDDRFDAVVDALADEFDPRQIALAAVRLAHADVAVDEAEIPAQSARPDRPDRSERRDGRPRRNATGHPGGEVRTAGGRKTRLFIGLGRNDRIRPGDLVGAIANESDLAGRDIGPIKITDRFSTVDVPEAAADAVIAAIKQTTIKGKRPTIRRDRHHSSNI
ncbi:MAG: DEAD/DEAH box helicase [Ilumatobacteraceae bacterium]